jgi:hypothetical protein
MQKRSHGLVGRGGFDLFRCPNLAQDAVNDHSYAMA